MRARCWISCLVLFVAAPGAAEDPSRALYEALRDRVGLSVAQEGRLEPYFAAHADTLRGMRLRLRAGELSYWGAFLEGRALRQALDTEAAAMLTESQLERFAPIRREMRGRFRAAFLSEEIRMLFGGVSHTRSDPDGVAIP